MVATESTTGGWFFPAINLISMWVSGAIGAFSLSNAVLFMTLLFTIIQTFFLLRNQWWRDRHGSQHDRRNQK